MASFIDTRVPPNARPAVRAVLKHHFWILAALVPPVMLPLLFMGSGAIGTQIDGKKQEIDGKISQVKQVSGKRPHPHAEWSKAIDVQADAVAAQISGEWQRLWDAQKSLRVWPPELGNDFVAAVDRLKTNGELSRPFLQRYQTVVPKLALKLPAVMDVPAASPVATDGAAGPGGIFAPGFPGGPGAVPGPDGANPAAMVAPPKMVWNPADQARIFQSFSWKAVPSTRQVLMAQEQLWVYGLFGTIFREFVKDATGPHDCPVPFVEEIAISHDAAERGPGGMGENRVLMPARPGGAGGMMGMDPAMGMGSGMAMGPGMDMGMGGGAAPGGRGMRLRPGSGGAGMPDFGGGGAPGMDMGPGAGSATAAPTDAELMSFAYVDFGGQALTADKLATEPGAEMTHLMPFVLRLVIDQRQIDNLLVALAAAEVPIDVRQIRINADGGAARLASGGGSGEMAGFPAPGMASGMGFAPGMPGGGPPAGLRRHDVRLELRGTVALATKPGDPVVIKPAGGQFGEAGGPVRASQAAWWWDRRFRAAHATLTEVET